MAGKKLDFKIQLKYFNILAKILQMYFYVNKNNCTIIVITSTDISEYRTRLETQRWHRETHRKRKKNTKDTQKTQKMKKEVPLKMKNPTAQVQIITR